MKEHRSGGASLPGLVIRPRAPEDDAAIVRIHNTQEVDSAPMAPEELRQEEGAAGQRLVALLDGRVVGYAGFHPAWWTGRTDVYALEVRVERELWGQGIGSRLYGALRSRLTAEGAHWLLAWIRADVPEARHFADRHGFADTGQVIEECRLFIPEARQGHYGATGERLRREGICIASLDEVGEDDAFLRDLRRLWDGGEANDAPAFETWRASVLRGPGLSPRTHWVALEGDRPVGTTFLKRLSEDAAENDYTAVAPSHRGRGIAPALKLHAIAWARENGVAWFYTSSLVGNAPMIAINRKLGYRPGVRKHEVACDLQ